MKVAGPHPAVFGQGAGGENMSRMPLVALVLAVGISGLVIGQPALPNAPASGQSSATRSVAYLSAGDSGRVWLAVGFKETALLGQRPDMYNRILLYGASSAGRRRWEKVLDLSGTRSLERIWFFGSGRIVAWFREPTRDVIFHSADGGSRWRSYSTELGQRDTSGPSHSDISFISPTEGWMLVSTFTGMSSAYPRLYQTLDGGNHWKEITLVQSSRGGLGFEHKAGIEFRDANTGWVGTEPRIIFDEAYLYISRDGGATWSQQSLPPPPGKTPDDFNRVLPPRFFGTRYGVAVSQWMDTEFVYHTSDGGLTWADPRPVPAVSHPDADRAWDMLSITRWAVGSNRTLWLTSDGGRTWSKHSVPLPPTHKIFRVAFLGPSRIWLIGYQGPPFGMRIHDYVLETRDAGQHWTRVQLPQGP